MTHIDFFPYHNYHIRFKLYNGQELSGVIVDSLKLQEKKGISTLYAFIPTSKMIEWKQAEQKGDKDKMKKYENEIDIQNIIWAKRIKY